MGLQDRPFWNRFKRYSFRASRLQVRAARQVLADFETINGQRRKNWDFLSSQLPQDLYGERFSRVSFFKYVLYSETEPKPPPILANIPMRRVIHHAQNTGLQIYENMRGSLYEFSCERSLVEYDRLMTN